MYLDYCEQLNNAMKRNRRPLLDALSKLAITQVTIDYKGCNESGDITRIKVTPRKATKKLSSNQIQFYFPQATLNGANLRYPLVAKTLSLKDALKEFATQWLGFEHENWELGEGSSGTVEIDVIEKCFHLDHNEYATQSYSYEYKL